MGHVMFPRRSSLLFAAAGLMLTVAGCGVQKNAAQVGSTLSGNWAFTPASSKLALNVGFTQGAFETVTAVGRLNGSSCVSPNTDIILTGSVDGSNQMTLVSSPFGGSVLTLKGTVAPNSTSMTAASWDFSGGSCAKLGTMSVTATDYAQIAGTYEGPFNDNAGNAGTI